jgi:hypothetical protein
MKKHALPPIGGLFFCHDRVSVPPNAGGCVESYFFQSRRQPFRHIPHQDKGCCPRLADQADSDPRSLPTAANRACWLLIRRRRAGRHDRRPAQTVLFPFFPRSVGFGPTDSSANGALFVLPSTLCHSQAIPSISSYSARPAAQICSNTPARAHIMKYAWIALPAPNSDFGNAFHWMPVRATYTIAANTVRFGMGLLPAPGARRYFRFGSRSASGIKGSTFDQNSSEIVQDLSLYGVGRVPWLRAPRRLVFGLMHRNIIYG